MLNKTFFSVTKQVFANYTFLERNHFSNERNYFGCQIEQVEKYI